MSANVASRGEVLDTVEAAPVFQAIHDPSPDVREAIFQALIRLPLGPSDWRKVAEYGKWVIESSESDRERGSVISATPYIPVRSFREQVAQLVGGESRWRFEAAMALAVLGDARAVPTLLGMVSTSTDWARTEAARSLATVDVSSARDAIMRVCAGLGTSAEEVITRFLLALSLARSGDDAELRRLYDDLGSGRVDAWELHYGPKGVWHTAGFSPEDLVGPPLPAETARWLEAVGRSEHGFAPLAQMILAASSRARGRAEGSKLAPAWAAGSAPGFTRLTDSEAAQARARVLELGLLDANGHLSIRGMATARREGLEGVAAALAFEQCPGRTMAFALGNDIVRWIASFQREFKPDAIGLVHAYALCAGRGRDVLWQIGWAASRGGLRGLMAQLAGPLASADPSERVAAAHLLADAADYAAQGAEPLFGGGEGPSGPAVSEAIVEDLPRAAPEPPAEEEAAALPTTAEFERLGPGRGVTRGIETRAHPATTRREPPHTGIGADTRSAASHATAGAGGAASSSPTAGGADRFVRVDIWNLGKNGDRAGEPLRQTLEKSKRYEIEIQIAAQGGSIVADRIFPAPPGLRQIDVFFLVLTGPYCCESQSIELPGSGPSSACSFRFMTPKTDVFRARILFLYRNTVLQTTLLSAPLAPAAADARITLTVQPPLHASFDQIESREETDVAIVHHEGGRTATAIAKGEPLPLRLGDTRELTRRFTKVLDGMPADPDSLAGGLDSKPMVALLCALAGKGKLLRNKLELNQPKLAVALAAARRIQILSIGGDAVLPLELVYDLEPPVEPNVCQSPTRMTGHCHPEFHTTAEDGDPEVVCPSGFWAISKVIERGSLTEDEVVGIGGAELAVALGPGRGQDSSSAPGGLSGVGGILFGASERVQRSSLESMASALAAVTEAPVCWAKDWDEWKANVKSGPSILVLLSHSMVSDKLEIGGKSCPHEDIDKRYVRPPGAPEPLVLLLGCETATTDSLLTYVSTFLISGAAMVVGTIATVPADSAPDVAVEMIEALKRAQGGAHQRFGEVMLDVRRQLLDKGEPLAMCIAAYGDADRGYGGQ